MIPSTVYLDESAARNRMYVQRGFLQLLLGSLQHGLLRLIVTGNLYGVAFCLQGCSRAYRMNPPICQIHASFSDTALDELLDLTAQLAMCNDQTSQKVALAVLAKSATDSDARWRRAVTTSVHVCFIEILNAQPPLHFRFIKTRVGHYAYLLKAMEKLLMSFFRFPS